MPTPATQTAIDRVAAAAWQRLFAGTASLARFAQLAWVAAFIALWLWAGLLAPRYIPSGWLLAASLLPGLVAIYCGYRVGLDAALFLLLEPALPIPAADFAAGMDRFRAQLAGREPAGGGPLAQRYAGAFRWWRCGAGALGLQTGLMLVAAVWVIF
jgi:hypothetical protein